jgi:proline dehydrogenase
VEPIWKKTALQIIVNNIDSMALCCGTHNESSSLMLVEMMEARKVSNNHRHIWFSQLYGMSDHISYNLANKGYNVCKYVPYGPVEAVLPYLIRRAQENTSVAGQTSRELSLLRQELKRRNDTKKA